MPDDRFLLCRQSWRDVYSRRPSRNRRASSQQPLAKKQALAIETVGGNRGYSGLMHEALDPKRGADMKEAFNIGLDLAPDDPELLAGVPFRSLNAWPDLPDFKRVLLGYFDDCVALGQHIHRAFALDLGLHPGFFEDKLDRSMATLRLLHYPAMPADAPARSVRAPASIPTTATSRCSRPTRSAASK